LAGAAQLLADQATAVLQQLEAVARAYDLGDGPDSVAMQTRLTVPKLAAWVANHAEIVGRQTASLGWLSGLLADGRDVPAQMLPDRLSSLAELGKVRVQVVSLCNRAWPGEPAPQAAEERDWSALRGCAEGLLQFLNRWRGPLSAPLVRALTSSEVRTRLTEAVRQSDATCAAGWGL
jgi:hypothetical protein